MKRVLWFIAGLVSGVGLVLWWGGRRSKALTGQSGEVNDIEDHLTTGDVEVELLTNGLIELWQPSELIILSATQLDDICRWWGGRKREHDEDIWKKHIGNVVVDLNKDMCKVIRKVEALADTQPIKVKESKDE